MKALLKNVCCPAIAAVGSVLLIYNDRDFHAIQMVVHIPVLWLLLVGLQHVVETLIPSQSVDKCDSSALHPVRR